ncbi:MAG TPA: FHA domain-containing protein [Myxococcaceae bacterium]|nr:FHA domain-containing protein [Myxococcaceae bacterium]
MKSFLLSTLLPELDLRDEAAFARAHPHSWLLREPTAWHATHPDGNQTLLMPAAVAAPLEGTALAIALEPVVRDATHVTLGRSPSCDLVIEEGTVSQVHLVFRQVDEAWTVEDAGSTNGSWLDGVRLEKAVAHRLAEGARLQTAQVLFTFASSSGVWRRLEAEALRH